HGAALRPGARPPRRRADPRVPPRAGGPELRRRAHRRARRARGAPLVVAPARAPALPGAPPRRRAARARARARAKGPGPPPLPRDREGSVTRKAGNPCWCATCRKTYPDLLAVRACPCGAPIPALRGEYVL